MDFGKKRKIPLLIGTVLGEFDFGPAISENMNLPEKKWKKK